MTPKDVIEKTRMARDILLGFGYDIFENAEFVEMYLCCLLGGKQTKHNSHWDCVLSGAKIEIKHSSELWLRRESHTFAWSKIYGQAYGKLDLIDYYLFSGWSGNFHFWLIPYDVVSINVNKNSLWRSIDENKKPYTNNRTKVAWMDEYYICGEKELVQKALKIAEKRK